MWDSGDELEAKHAEQDPAGELGFFNPDQAEADKAVGDGFDKRSDDKGVEPETLDIGTCGGALTCHVEMLRSSEGGQSARMSPPSFEPGRMLDH